MVDPNNYLEYHFNEQVCRLYVVPGVSMDTKFQAQTRQEIKVLLNIPTYLIIFKINNFMNLIVCPDTRFPVKFLGLHVVQGELPSESQEGQHLQGPLQHECQRILHGHPIPQVKFVSMLFDLISSDCYLLL